MKINEKPLVERNGEIQCPCCKEWTYNLYHSLQDDKQIDVCIECHNALTRVGCIIDTLIEV